jgi:hypothetical protein
MSRPTTFAEFWPFYLGEHSNRLNRRLHFVGSSLALLWIVGAIGTGHASLALLSALSGYGFAWCGHFFIEKNRPASFKFPLWSFAADWKMWGLTLTGRLDAELRARGVSV